MESLAHTDMAKATTDRTADERRSHSIDVRMKNATTRTFEDAEGTDYRFRLAARVGFAVITDRFGTEVWIPVEDIMDITVRKAPRI